MRVLWLPFSLLRVVFVITMLVCALLILALLALCMGIRPLSLVNVLDSVRFVAPERSLDGLLVMMLRLPRFIVGGLVGLSLAVSGVLLQTVSRNVLADPTLTGVMSGAALAVVATLLLFPTVSALWHPLIAMIGGGSSALLSVVLAWRGHLSPLRFALSGLTVAALGNAAIVSLLVVTGPQAGPIFYWLAGGLAGVGWFQVTLILPWSILGCVLAFVFVPMLNTMALGDEAAEAVGLNLRFWRCICTLIAVGLAAAVVAVAGPIGFVGLGVPHLVRLTLGYDHRVLLPVAGLGGALLVTTADLLARTVVSPRELPVGFLTALTVVPLLIVLIRRRTGQECSYG